MQSVYLAAKRKSEQLGESVEGYAVEATKLTERLTSAEAQYVDGMRKVKAASKQLQYLEKEIAGSEATANSESSMHVVANVLSDHIGRSSLWLTLCNAVKAMRFTGITRHVYHAAGLAKTLRELPSAEAIALRAEVFLFTCDTVASRHAAIPFQ